MNLVSRTALAAAMAICGASLLATSPSFAEKKEAAAAPQRNFKLSKEERASLSTLQTAVTAKDAAAANAALPAARAAAKGADARYVLGQLMFQLGRDSNNVPLQGEGINMMVDSGSATSAELPNLLNAQVQLATQANDQKGAEAALNRLMQLSPNDPQTTLALAQLRSSQKRPGEAASLIMKAIEQQKATGQAVPESWYKVALKNAYDGKLAADATRISQAWIAAYPDPKNWRDAILIYRELGTTDPMVSLDAMRILRFTHSLAGERDFYDLANQLNRGGYPGEAKAVLDEGIASKALVATSPAISSLRGAAGAKVTADKASLASGEKSALAAASGTPALKIGDAYFGYGDYAKAISLYRAALQKGSVDANLVNTHLAMALALSGQKAEAQTALGAIGGARTDLANFLKIWLAQRA